MRASDALVEKLKEYEGYSASPYQDSAGIYTYGFGHTKNVAQFSAAISRQQAEQFLRDDIKETENAINRLVKVPLNQNQFDALVSFTFNLGAGALERSSLLRLLNRGAYDMAAKQFPLWVKAGGKTLPGLVKRRKSEQELFLTLTKENL